MVELLSTSDRVRNLEYNWPVIQRKIQAYDSVLDEWKVIKANQSEWIEKLVNNSNALDLIVKCVDGLKISMDKTSSEFAFALQERSKKILDVCSEVNDLKNSASSLNSEILNASYSLKGFVSEEIKKSASREDFNVLNKNISQSFQSIQSINERLSSIEDSLQKQNGDSISRYSDFIGQMDELRSRLDQFSSSLMNLNLNVDRNNTGFFDQVCQLKQSVLDAVDSKIASAKDDLSKTPPPVNALRDELKSLIESSSMDSQNAILKASNVDKKITFAEKKIENIYLMLEKLNLCE